MVRVGALRRGIARRASLEPRNPYWQDLIRIVEDAQLGMQGTRAAAAELLDLFYDAASDWRREGRADALKLMTAHGAKGLEFNHVIVMDCADWRWDQEDERRLLYVAMTRARETLTLMRAEGGRNPYLVDLGTVAGVHDVLPRVRPSHRKGLDRRYRMLGPAEVDLGFAGRCSPGNPVHRALAQSKIGERVSLSGRLVRSADGQIIGRLAARADAEALARARGTLHTILVRTRDQTPPEYQALVQVDAWEVPLIEVVLEDQDQGTLTDGAD